MSTLSVVIDLRLAGYRAGGIARYATELFNALRRQESLSIAAIRSQQDPDGEPHDLRFRTPPHHRFERYSLAVELALARRIPQVFHATDFIAPRVPRLATVATVHDLEFLRHPEHLDRTSLAHYRQIEQSRRWTDAWITPSEWTRDDLARSFDVDPSTITVIPHGIPRHLVQRTPEPRVSRRPFLLAVGTVEPRKRYDLLLDAISRLAPAPALMVVGKAGWNSADIEARLARTESVTWDQSVGDAQLRDLYRNAYAVIIPSESEGFGFAALEGMAAGTPIVSSGRGALPEVTGNAALVPASDEPEDWAQAIERILDDEHLWNELSMFGRRRAAHFSWERAARETIGVYHRIADR